MAVASGGLNPSGEDLALRQAFNALPKTLHGETALIRHPDIRPEWVVLITKEPYDRWQETSQATGNPMTILVGRVLGWDRWVKVVYEGNSPENGKFETAYSDRRLEDQYGGRPWQNQTPTRSPNQ